MNYLVTEVSFLYDILLTMFIIINNILKVKKFIQNNLMCFIFIINIPH